MHSFNANIVTILWEEKFQTITFTAYLYVYMIICDYVCMYISKYVYVYIYIWLRLRSSFSWPKHWTSLNRYILYAGLLSAVCLVLKLFVSIEPLNTLSKYYFTTALYFIWTSLSLIILSFDGIQPDFGTVHFGKTKK